MFRYLPEQASEIAPKIDWINNLITDLSVFFTVAIVGTAIYFAIRYRRKDGKDHETPHIHGSNLLELIWTITPTLISIYILYWGVKYYREIREVPKDAISISVYGQKWKWDFEYENGKETTGELYVPVNKPIKLVMTSRDVIHSFFLPSMRVKNDVIPEQYTYVSFKPVKVGTYQGFCTEYCGDMHWDMLAKLHVVSQDEFDRWLNDRSDEIMAAKMSPAERGADLYLEKGCNACHSVDGSPRIGPSFLKIYGRDTILTDGTKVTADENYLSQSILDPNSQVVKGFTPNMMPSFEGQLEEKEIRSLIAYFKTLDKKPEPETTTDDSSSSTPKTPEERGKALYSAKACIGCHSLDGSAMVGPSFKGLYGKKGQLTNGSSYTANDEYIKRSILKPADQVVEGFAPSMPPFEGQLSDEELNDIIAFIKSVKDE